MYLLSTAQGNMFPERYTNDPSSSIPLLHSGCIISLKLDSRVRRRQYTLRFTYLISASYRSVSWHGAKHCPSICPPFTGGS